MSARRLPSVGVTGWEFPRAAAGVRHLVGWAERAGLRAEPLLVGTGLARDDLDRVGTVTAAQELQVARALARRAPHAAADVGRRYTAESFGVMGWAITSSATVGDAADVALRFIDLSFAFVLPVVRLEGDRVVAERAMNRRLEGGCQVPIAGYALLDGDQIWLRGLVASEDGRRVLKAETRGSRSNAEALGVEVAESLLGQGADVILGEIYQRA